MKKNLLIFWHSRNIREIIFPVIKNLNQEFDIYIIIENDNFNETHKQSLIKLKENKIIKNFFIPPKNNNTYLLFKYYKKIAKKTSDIKFDIFLTNNNAQVVEKIICDFIIDKETKIVLLWPTITYLFMRYPDVVKSILKNNFYKKTKFKRKDLFYSKSKNYFFNILKIILNYSLHFTRFCKLLKNDILTKVIYPFFIFRKIYLTSLKEKLTQISDGNFDHLIFFDKIEKKVHKLFYDNPNVHFLNHSNNNFCKCKKRNKSNFDLLIPLSGYEKHRQIPDNLLNKYLREIKTLIANTPLKNVHLRPHPNMINYGWTNQLKEKLKDNNINTIVVDNNVPIREVICNYYCTAGFASNALRDARLACNNVLIIGFKSVSVSHFEFPDFVFGGTEKIRWINEDGTYLKDIFETPSLNENSNKIDVAKFLTNLIYKEKVAS